MSNDPYSFNFIIAWILKKKICFWLHSALESSKRMAAFLLSSPTMLKASSCSQSLPKKSVPVPGTTLISLPSPVLLTHSFSHFLWYFISESLNYSLESKTVSRKGCGSIHRHARLVSNPVISTAFYMVRDLSMQTCRKIIEKHPGIPLVLRMKGKGQKQTSRMLLAMFLNKHDSCHAVLWEPCPHCGVFYMLWVHRQESVPQGIWCRKCSLAGSRDACVQDSSLSQLGVWAFDSLGSDTSEILSWHLVQ